MTKTLHLGQGPVSLDDLIGVARHGRGVVLTEPVRAAMRVISGKTDAEIAVDLGLTEKSVDQMFKFLLAKLAVRTREEAVGLARQQGWI